MDLVLGLGAKVLFLFHLDTPSVYLNEIELVMSSVLDDILRSN